MLVACIINTCSTGFAPINVTALLDFSEGSFLYRISRLRRPYSTEWFTRTYTALG
jgi:hypothetical protein